MILRLFFKNNNLIKNSTESTDLFVENGDIKEGWILNRYIVRNIKYFNLILILICI